MQNTSKKIQPMYSFLCTEAHYLTLSNTDAEIYISKQKCYAGSISSASFVIDPQIFLFPPTKTNGKGTPGICHV